ncbi:MAG: SRPBCC family protein [Dehalococcoidia bacterium]
MAEDSIAGAKREMDAPASRVWDALTDPAQIKQYYFGTDLQTDWKIGSPMTFRGEWQGRAYENRGTLTAVEPNRRLAYTHWSPLSEVRQEEAERLLGEQSISPPPKNEPLAEQQEPPGTNGYSCGCSEAR